MIICQLLYTKFYVYPQQAQDFYAAMRTFNQKGLTIPSQIRYVNYFGQTVGKTVNSISFYKLPFSFKKKKKIRLNPFFITLHQHYSSKKLYCPLSLKFLVINVKFFSSFPTIEFLNITFEKINLQPSNSNWNVTESPFTTSRVM